MKELLEKISALIETYESETGVIVGASVLDPGTGVKSSNTEYVYNGERFTKETSPQKYTEQDVADAYQRGLDRTEMITSYPADGA